MKAEVHKADSRGGADHGWLKARHTFSFASYQNPQRVHFGRLRVLNDDVIEGGQGFGTHPHDNMEIVTVMLKGSLRHEDSMGNKYVIHGGEVQRMSAGTGITHSEFNALKDEETNLLQIWVLPKHRDIEPSYEQHTYGPETRKNQWQWLVRPDAKYGACGINQDSYFSRIDLSSGSNEKYQVQVPGNGVYIFVISGAAIAAKEHLHTRDGLAVSDVTEVTLAAKQDSELLVIEVPMT